MQKNINSSTLLSNANARTRTFAWLCYEFDLPRISHYPNINAIQQRLQDQLTTSARFCECCQILLTQPLHCAETLPPQNPRNSHQCVADSPLKHYRSECGRYVDCTKCSRGSGGGNNQSIAPRFSLLPAAPLCALPVPLPVLDCLRRRRRRLRNVSH